MLPPRQTRGFMLVHKTENLLSANDAEIISRGGQEYLQNLRNALNFINPENYRGISRDPLQPWSKTEENLFREGKKILIDLNRDQAARRKFLEMNGEDREKWDSYMDGWDYNQALIQDLSIAIELKKIVDSPEDYEIILRWLSREIQRKGY